MYQFRPQRVQLEGCTPIRGSIDHLEAQLEIQGRQVQRALEEGRDEVVLVPPNKR